MKILVADKFEKSGLEGLRATGSEVIFEPDLKDDALASRLAESGADVLVVRSTKVTAAILDRARSLALVIRAGAGVNTIDLAAASRNGVFVANCTGKNAIAVAELAMGLILSLDRRIPENAEALRRGEWNKKEFAKGRTCGATLGIAGMGTIGREVAARGRAFDARDAWSRSLTRKAPSAGSRTSIPWSIWLGPSTSSRCTRRRPRNPWPPRRRLLRGPQTRRLLRQHGAGRRIPPR
jgi:D-3-phosphoglycerate dehydrogenase